MDRIVAVLQGFYKHSLLARRHVHGVVGALCAAEVVLHAGCHHHAEALVPEAVACRHASAEVWCRHGVCRDACRSCRKVAGRRLVVGSEGFVWRLASDVGAVGREILSVRVHEVVGQSHCSVGLQHASVWRVFHHHVDDTASRVALHVCRQRLRHHEPVHEVAGEDVERNVSVFVVGAWYFDAVYQRVVVAFVHASQYGV